MSNSLQLKVSARHETHAKIVALALNNHVLCALLLSFCLNAICISEAYAANDPAPAIVTIQALNGVPELNEVDDGYLASIFSGTGILAVVGIGLFGLLVSRKLNARANEAGVKEEEPRQLQQDTSKSVEGVQTIWEPNVTCKSHPTSANTLVPFETQESGFGASYIDQEVGKLIQGQPHRIDVLSSRSIEYRHAIESSLLKSLSEVNQDASRRARQALEDYGFVARRCAVLLLAQDPFERTSAARSLGEIRSLLALPFLLEGLYDSESIVRNQAVISIGELRVPSAIGALLDMARRHPDVPYTLVSRALSSCSVDGIGSFYATDSDSSLLVSNTANIINEMTQFRQTAIIEGLPQTSDDQDFLDALLKCDSENQVERSEAARTFALFKLESSVSALSAMAIYDQEEAVRTVAIESLAEIDHWSVFPAFLMALSDDACEVRAAAARSFSRLSFDRAEAYVRVMETAAADFLTELAEACLKSGIADESIEHLASSDRRQAYESFAVISLLAKANMTQPVLSAIASHPNIEVRLLAMHFLATTGQPGLLEKFRELASAKDVPKEVQTALLDAMTTLEERNTERFDETNRANLTDALSLNPEVPTESELEVETAAH
jgi:HEAT repeat protein